MIRFALKDRDSDKMVGLLVPNEWARYVTDYAAAQVAKRKGLTNYDIIVNEG